MKRIRAAKKAHLKIVSAVKLLQKPQTGMEEITAYDLLPGEENNDPAVTDSNVDPKKNISQMANKIELMIAEINRK